VGVMVLASLVMAREAMGLGMAEQGGGRDGAGEDEGALSKER